MAVSRSVVVAVTADPADPDQARLHQLGYKQELKRGLSVLSNFAISFSIISVLAGVITTYNTGLRYGGTASMTLGWLVVAAFNGCVALSMAEICSAYPTSGGLYYWSAKLAGKKWASLASWVTGCDAVAGCSAPGCLPAYACSKSERARSASGGRGTGSRSRSPRPTAMRRSRIAEPAVGPGRRRRCHHHSELMSQAEWGKMNGSIRTGGDERKR